jgi:hypothetical protein
MLAISAPRVAAPPCPKCGQSEAAIVSQRPNFAGTDPYHERGPTGTLLVYKCSCGCAFTHTVRVGERH